MSVAVMSRIQLIEAPYLDEFVNWYLQLGFDQIYFLNTEPQNESKIKEFIRSELLASVTFVNHTTSTNNFSYLRNMFTNIATQDYILHADCDEYLMLPKKYTNISDFVKQHDYDKYVFRWVNIPIDQLFSASMTQYLLSAKSTGRRCGTMKMMVKRTSWLNDPKAGCDPHSFKCAGSGKTMEMKIPDGNSPFYIHFLVRGYLHTVIKVFEQRLPTERGQTPKNINKLFLTTNDLVMKIWPFRVISACGEYTICNRQYIDPRMNTWRIPKYTEYNKQKETLELYQSVLTKFGIECNENILVEDIYNLAKKFNDCTNIIDEKFKTRLTARMPSEIGRNLKRWL